MRRGGYHDAYSSPMLQVLNFAHNGGCARAQELAKRWIAASCIFSAINGCGRQSPTQTPHQWRQLDAMRGATACVVSPQAAIECAAILPHGRGIVAGYNGNVEVLNLDGTVRSLTSECYAVTGVVLSEGGELCASSSTSGDLYVWETASWKCLAHRQFGERTECLGFTGDSKHILLARGRPPEVVVVDAVNLNEASTIVPRTKPSFSDAVYSARLNLLALYYPGKPAGQIRLVSTITNGTRELATLSASPTWGLAIAGGNRVLAACSDGRIRVISIDNGETITTSEPNEMQPISIAAGTSGELFVTTDGTYIGQPSKLVVRSCKTGKACLELAYPKMIGHAWFDSDQRVVLGGCGG